MRHCLGNGYPCLTIQSEGGPLIRPGGTGGGAPGTFNPGGIAGESLWRGGHPELRLLDELGEILFSATDEICLFTREAKVVFPKIIEGHIVVIFYTNHMPLSDFDCLEAQAQSRADDLRLYHKCQARFFFVYTQLCEEHRFLLERALSRPQLNLRTQVLQARIPILSYSHHLLKPRLLQIQEDQSAAAQTSQDDDCLTPRRKLLNHERIESPYL